MDTDTDTYDLPPNTLGAMVELMLSAVSGKEWEQLLLKTDYLSDDASTTGLYRVDGDLCVLEDYDDDLDFLIGDERQRLIDLGGAKVWNHLLIAALRARRDDGISVKVRADYGAFSTFETLSDDQRDWRTS